MESTSFIANTKSPLAVVVKFAFVPKWSCNSVIPPTTVVALYPSSLAISDTFPCALSNSFTAPAKSFAVVVILDATNCDEPPLIARFNSLIDDTISALVLVFNDVISPTSSCTSLIASTNE